MKRTTSVYGFTKGKLPSSSRLSNSYGSKQCFNKALLMRMKSNKNRPSVTESSILHLHRPFVPDSDSETSANQTNNPPESNISVREQVYKCLHRPTGVCYLYHMVLIVPLIISCYILNILPPKEPFDDQFVYHHYNSIHIGMIFIDSWLAEAVLRLWSAGYRSTYDGWLGKIFYLRDCACERLLDLFGVITFLGYILFSAVLERQQLSVLNTIIANIDVHLLRIELLFRFMHVLQLLQFHRLIYRLCLPIYRTVRNQRSQLWLTMFTMLVLLALCSFTVYLAEIKYSTHPCFRNILDAIWLSWTAFSTVGYGDIVPDSPEGRLILSMFSLMGVCAFVLPSHIIGNGLSMELLNQRRLTFKYLSTAELIRTSILHYKTARQPSNILCSKRERMSNHTLLLTQHIKATTTVSKFNLLDNDKLPRINLNRFEPNHKEDMEDVDLEQNKLWYKLLQISRTKMNKRIHSIQRQQSISGSAKSVSNLKSLSKTFKPSQQHSKINRVMEHFENVDFTRYSNDNTLLWYNLNLIEDNIADINYLVLNRITPLLDNIRHLCRKTLVVAAAAETEASAANNKTLSTSPL